ncbi:hypothetical protein L6R52_36255 [Myxococcota bacterium]|nr:hypothetical protein [Myxococcota bacterium]
MSLIAHVGKDAEMVAVIRHALRPIDEFRANSGARRARGNGAEDERDAGPGADIAPGVDVDAPAAPHAGPDEDPS